MKLTFILLFVVFVSTVEAEAAQCKVPYGTADGRPSYNVTLPECSGGVVMSPCRCSRCGDIRVIVAMAGESCDSDGYWDAKTSGFSYYTEKARDKVNFGFEDKCDIKCEEAYEGENLDHARDAGGASTRRFLRTDFLKATQLVNGENVNYVCLPAEFADRQSTAKRDFECTGCKQCKDDAENFDFGYKHPTYEFNGKLYGGCYPWCKAAFEDDSRGPEKVCKWKKCSGCTKCKERADEDSHEGVVYNSTDLDSAQKDTEKTKSLFKFKVPTEDIKLNGELHGGCFPWCRTAFFDVNRGSEKICKWKKCSGCKACEIWSSNHDDTANDGFRYKINNKEIDTNDNERKSQTKKKYGGCLRHCKNSAETRGLEKICNWRGCGGCEICVPGAVILERIPENVKTAEVSRNGVFKTIGDILYEKIAGKPDLVPENKRGDYSTGTGTVDQTAKQNIAALFERKKKNRGGNCPTLPADCECGGILCLGKCQKDRCKGCDGCIR